ncbi:Lar family restriction alleviation protein [Pseudomonas aeruginosa]|uniref:Lar family restriction alleviation protein n=1 Tax=Pseudomonas aeruginosa TaxID=287 RepID=UPI003857E786
MAEELKPCPFCGCSMRLVSNHDWHRILGDHSADCVFLDSETMMVPDIEDQREIAIADWNTRAVPAGHVVVPREVLERSIDRWACCAMSQTPGAEEAWEGLRALLSEQEGGKQ